MADLDSLLEAHLRAVGGLKAAQAGGLTQAERLAANTQESIGTLRTQLEGRFEDAKRTATVFTVLLCLLFVAGLVMAFLQINNPAFLGGTLASLIAAFVVLLNMLKRLWKEMVGSELLVNILPNMTPEQAVVVIQNVYFASKAKGSGTSP
jgi:lipopolysaccharide export LptBFGC system permease protein LptF